MTRTMPLVAQRIVLCVLATGLLLDVGCVSRGAYERVKAETLEQTHTLEAVREDVKELDLEIAGLQASNRRDDAAMSELRAAIQREEDQLPVMRQRAEDTLSSLKAQVATLINQSWHLARKIVDIRQESASLQTKVAQYKEALEASRTPVSVVSERHQPAITQDVVTETPAPAALPDQDDAPPQSAQLAPVTPNLAPAMPSPPSPSPSVNVEPPTVSDSWIGIITGWFIKIWNWLFG